jgi:anti-sigma B factor antagonist
MSERAADGNDKMARSVTREAYGVELQLEVTTENGYTVLTPRGDLDVATVRELRAAIHDQLAAGNVHLVLDLDEIEFIDSTGLGVLIGTRRRTFDLRGSFSIVCENQRVLRLLDLTSLDKVFTIHAEREDATARSVARSR